MHFPHCTDTASSITCPALLLQMQPKVLLSEFELSFQALVYHMKCYLDLQLT